jgi:hypothetical protein
MTMSSLRIIPYPGILAALPTIYTSSTYITHRTEAKETLLVENAVAQKFSFFSRHVLAPCYPKTSNDRSLPQLADNTDSDRLG